MTCWHVITCKHAWNARNGLRFGSPVPKFIMCQAGHSLGFMPSGTEVAERPTGLAVPFHHGQKRRDTPKAGGLSG